MSIKIAVTGATGQVGRELAALLQQKKIPNQLLVRQHKSAAFPKHPSSSFAAFDFTEPKTHAAALQGATRLFFVCNSSVAKNSITEFLRVAKRVGVEKVIVMSGMGADKSKSRALLDLETLVQEAHLPYVALRANWFFQNFGSHFREMVHKRHALTFPDGGAPISFVDARDIAEVALHLLTSPVDEGPLSYEITGPESLTHAAVADLFSKHLPYRVIYRGITEREAQDELGWSGEWLRLFEDIREGITAPVSEDTRKILGKEPRRLESYIIENKHLWMS